MHQHLTLDTQEAITVVQPTPQARTVYGEWFDNRARYIAQSILTGIIDKPELPTLDEARDIIAWAEARARHN